RTLQFWLQYSSGCKRSAGNEQPNAPQPSGCRFMIAESSARAGDCQRSLTRIMLSTRIVTQLPLNRLWDNDGDIAAQRERYLSRASLREMLRQNRVQFYVADISRPLRRVDVADCYDFWTSE